MGGENMGHQSKSHELEPGMRDIGAREWSPPDHQTVTAPTIAAIHRAVKASMPNAAPSVHTDLTARIALELGT